MKTLMLLSVILASIGLPARGAMAKNPKQGLKKTLVNMMVFNAIYLFGLMYLYARL
jgi:hypothetical protein